MKKKWLGILMGATLAIGLAACGNAGKADKDNTTTASAEEIVNKSCISCHGENSRRSNGPALDKIGSKLSKDEILDAIVNGRAGMPAGLVKGEDAEKLPIGLQRKNNGKRCNGGFPLLHLFFI